MFQLWAVDYAEMHEPVCSSHSAFSACLPAGDFKVLMQEGNQNSRL